MSYLDRFPLRPSRIESNEIQVGSGDDHIYGLGHDIHLSQECHTRRRTTYPIIDPNCYATDADHVAIRLDVKKWSLFISVRQSIIEAQLTKHGRGDLCEG